LTLGALVAFLQYSVRFFRPISDMSEKFNILQSAMASSERIFKLLDERATIQSPPAPRRRPKPAAGHIVFEHVWFSYQRDGSAAIGAATPGPMSRGDTAAHARVAEDSTRIEDITHGQDDGDLNASSVTDDYVLRDISFEVRPGQRVGIVGATGSGKTTLINLLMRFYDVTRGRITIDGVDIRELDLDDVRGLFSLVLQDVHLFSGTIAENIRLGNNTVDDDRLRDAARAVHADVFIERLPDGYQSAVAERGATLSTGQKQLLSFARALAFDPRVLILDEATSSVDTETELLIRDALHTLMVGRTTIAVAHRLSTIQDMDQILVFHKGRLREAGTHQELLAARGIYFRLFELQYKGETPVEDLELRT
jgi:ATP-binding cassette subfamily B protein